ncbi:hypothetical protein M8009_00570 [Halomonas sp. ATCH28]|uniref:Uncharacterized protein n=1 Tax=Halomonas gemina TaxID=2945105 RepID=A0ABT0SWW1_9GAMM|nr:hypothetical protein [Halomonas gemina]MCL7938796.1 hypothetical protein [Halomonas gemina]
MTTKDKTASYTQDPFSYTEIHEGVPLDDEHGAIGMLFVHDPKHLHRVDGCIIDLENGTLRRPEQSADTSPHRPDPAAEAQSSNSSTKSEPAMSTQDPYVEARLYGIEKELDAKIDGMRDLVARMENGFNKAEERFERSSERHSAEVSLLSQKFDSQFDSARRHSTTTAWATVGGVLAGFAIVIAIAVGWIAEQGSYAKSYGETQVEIQQAADERGEIRDVMRDIQSTQQTILDRLPSPESQ